MIEFATLFLGLYLGVTPVEVLVGADVASVEFLLDGESVGHLRGPPWILPCDLGSSLLPHELVAVARDSADKETGRARQRINVPRSGAEVRLVVRLHGARTPPTAHVAWNTALGDDPREIRATLDGSALTVEDPLLFDLPVDDSDEIHFLRVELEFPASGTAGAEAVFGGRYGSELSTELTAIPVWFRSRRGPSASELQGRFRAEGEPLRVVEIEEGPGDVVLVPAGGSREDLLELTGRPRRGVRSGDRWLGAPVGRTRFAASFSRDLRIRILWPWVQTLRRGARERSLVRPSSEMSPWDGGLLTHLGALPVPLDVGSHRPADAVAAAALVAAERGRRRAVVLVLPKQEMEDSSRLTPSQVTGFLEQLGVPLFVWSLEEQPEATAWGRPVSVASLTRLERALNRMGDVLKRQRIVWLESPHLPREVALEGHPDVDRVGVQPFVEDLPDRTPKEVDETPARGDEAVSIERRSRGLDRERLGRALAAMDGPVARSRLGPFELYSDLRERHRLLALAPVAASLPEVYRERFGLEIADAEPESVVLYAREESYRAHGAEGVRGGDDGIAGHAGGGLAVLFVGDRNDDQVRALLVHELTHLINRRAFRARPPPWLEEGLADELSLARWTSHGQPIPGTYWGGSRLDSDGRQVVVERAGAYGSLHDLGSRALRGRLIPLARLLDLPPDAFVAPADRPLRYAQSAFFVRFLMEGDRGRRRDGFRKLLADVDSGAPADAAAVERALGESLDSLEAAFRSWLRFQQSTVRR